MSGRSGHGLLRCACGAHSRAGGVKEGMRGAGGGCWRCGLATQPASYLQRQHGMSEEEVCRRV